MALVRVPFYFINLWLTVTDSHFVHIYTTYEGGPLGQLSRDVLKNRTQIYDVITVRTVWVVYKQTNTHTHTHTYSVSDSVCVL